MTDLFYLPTSSGPVLTVGGLPLFLPTAEHLLSAETTVDRPIQGRALDEGCDFFQVQGAAARERLEAAA